MLKANSFLMAILLVLSLAFTGCATDSKKGSGEEGETVVDAQANSLELNGTSDDGTAGMLQSIYFGYDSSRLTDEGKANLEQNAQWLKSNSTVDIQIEGHCDERGGVQYNLALGEKRANVVKGYLEALGVNSARISIISYGKEKPVAFGHEEAAWGKNRRANFVVTAK